MIKKKYKTLKLQATKLRKRGWSYNKIKKEINVSKSTLSFWLKNVKLKPEHRQRLYTKQIKILSLGPQSQKERRGRQIDEIIKKAQREIKKPLSKETHRLFGAALYWAEGSKGKRFQITNSDPHLVIFMVKWIGLVFNIKPAALKARLNIYPQQKETDIKKFWSNLTNIPLNNFGKSYTKPYSKGYKKNNLYYGTIRVEIPKSADMVHQVYGWTKILRKSAERKVEFVQKRWSSLRAVSRPINL